MPIPDPYQADAYATFANTLDAVTVLPAPSIPLAHTDPYSEFLAYIDD